MDIEDCMDEDISVKSFFLGPGGENFKWFEEQIISSLAHWNKERIGVNEEVGRGISPSDRENIGYKELQSRIEKSIKLMRSRLQADVPFYSPKFISHMAFESSVAGIIGHFLTMLHNPNLVSSEVSKSSRFIEDEAIEELVEMVGYSKKGKGHFTSGGTVANIEALWRARFRLDHWLSLGAAYDEKFPDQKSDWMKWAHMGWQKFYEMQTSAGLSDEALMEKSFVLQNPYSLAVSYKEQYGKNYLGPVLLVPGNKHYSWQKGLSLLGYGMESFWQVKLDEQGRMRIDHLEELIEKARAEARPILMVVSVAGTTEMGAMDPVSGVQDLLDKYKNEHGLHIWHHVDGAYGGYYCSMLRGDRRGKTDVLPARAIKALLAISRSDSVTIDPHKLGYVPYACGAILFPSDQNYETTSFAAPYIGEEKERWLRTLEGSRAATGAGATWLTAKSIGLNKDGIGKVLEKGIFARRRLQRLFHELLPQARFFDEFDTNVFCFVLANDGDSLKRVNERSLAIFKEFTGKNGFYVSKTKLKFNTYGKYIDRLVDTWRGKRDDDNLVFIRVVFMNPFVVSKELSTDVEKEFVERLKAFC